MELADKEDRNRCDAQAALGWAKRDTAGRLAASLGMLNGHAPEFVPVEAVSGDGVLTALLGPSLVTRSAGGH